MDEPIFSDDRSPEIPAKDRSSGGRLLALLVLGAALIGVTYSLAPGGGDLNVPLSELHLEPLTGGAEPLELDDLSGKVVLINFWGTWCSPCRIEFPHLMEMKERLQSESEFQFVSVSCSPGDADRYDVLKEPTEQYLMSENFELPVHFDPEGMSVRAMGVDLERPFFNFPTTVLLDRNGVIRQFWEGYRPGLEQEMERKIRDLL